MLKIKLFLLFSICMGVSLFSQINDIEWQKCLGGYDTDAAAYIQQTNDGGYIVTGYVISNDGDVSNNHGMSDIWVAKLSSSGSIDWQKCLGGSNNEYSYFIMQTRDNGYLITGKTNSNDGNVSANHGNYDGWLIKLDNWGNIQWSKCIGGSNDEEIHYAIQTENGYVVVGFTISNDGDVSNNHGNYDYWLVQLDDNGNIIWQKCYGGSSNDRAYEFQQTNDGGFIIGGSSSSNDGDVSGNHGGVDYWVTKLDINGNLQWQKSYGGSSEDELRALELTDDGGYIIGGFVLSDDGDVIYSHPSYEYWVAKLDAYGNIQWKKSLGGSGMEFLSSIKQTADGGYVIAGRTNTSNDGDVSGWHGCCGNSDAWIVKLSSLGDLLWQKCVGGTEYDYSNCIQITSDGGYILAGDTKSNDYDVYGNHNSSDYWIVKLSPHTFVNEYNFSHTLLIYPNPLTEYSVVTFDNSNKDKYKLLVIDITGKILYEIDNIRDNYIKIDRNLLTAGVYFIELIGPTIYYDKLIVE